MANIPTEIPRKTGARQKQSTVLCSDYKEGEQRAVQAIEQIFEEAKLREGIEDVGEPKLAAGYSS